MERISLLGDRICQIMKISSSCLKSVPLKERLVILRRLITKDSKPDWEATESFPEKRRQLRSKKSREEGWETVVECSTQRMPKAYTNVQ